MTLNKIYGFVGNKYNICKTTRARSYETFTNENYASFYGSSLSLKHEVFIALFLRFILILHANYDLNA